MNLDNDDIFKDKNSYKKTNVKLIPDFVYYDCKYGYCVAFLSLSLSTDPYIFEKKHNDRYKDSIQNVIVIVIICNKYNSSNFLTKFDEQKIIYPKEY
ncbi:hypothetical protein RFI_35530 [Reticulomyxa filosa]|uniref:Uncharacterized protein n=1 Tax=Reticulomyxa filosa TaxID=46433 RepID=X6LJ12_RETFI|nr:hypothetical protein RFI_35530 [Reticulomyxa filosa]|eukprot:ETO01908.1 hypothetical protein RFI_35530 [Reticulomyxa filosa]